MHPSRPRRLATRLAVVATTVTALLATSAPGAQAAVRDHDMVSRADVLKVFPQLRHNNNLATSAWKEKVLRYPNPEACSTPAEAQGRSGREFGTGYGMAEEPRTFNAYLVQFGQAQQARLILRSAKAHVTACAQYWAGVNSTVRPAKVPRVGDQRVAFRTVKYFQDGPQEVTTVVVRDGKRVLIMTVMEPGTVKARKLAQISRIAARKMG